MSQLLGVSQLASNISLFPSGFGRDRNGRDRDTAADSEHAPSAQLTGHVAPNAVAGAARRSPSAVLQARPCAEIDNGEPLGKVEILP